MLPSPEMILRALGYGVVLPAAVVVAGLLLGLRFRGGARIAIAAGLCAGFAALADTQQIQWGFVEPSEAWDWLPALALLALLVSLLEEVPLFPVAARLAVRLAVAALTGWLLVRAQSAREPLSPWWMAGIAAAVLALWGVLDSAARRWPGFGMPSLLALILFGTAAVCELSANLTFAHLAGVLAGVLAGEAEVRLLAPRPASPGPAVPAVAVMLPGLLFVCYHNSYSSVPAASYLLLLASPIGLGAAVLLTLRGGTGHWHTALRAAGALAPLGAAVVLAALA